MCFFFLLFVLYMPLLAFVCIGFNKGCFLRSRCSNGMWCPDDMGRESWDWVGPPTRVEWRLLACQNGASPDCIIIVVVLCCMLLCCCVLCCCVVVLLCCCVVVLLCCCVVVWCGVCVCVVCRVLLCCCVVVLLCCCVVV